MSSLQQKYWVFHEITVGATCTKHAACKQQATGFFEEACVLNTDAAIFDLQEANSSRIWAVGWCPQTSPGLNSKCPNFGKVLEATYSRLVSTSKTLFGKRKR
jgi:hypothetical protein